jgi:hypothetical protein
MSTLEGSGSIIKDGLVLCLDGANSRSYPGTGTTWTDLSRSGNNGSLVNGPTFNSLNGGSIVLDGTNDLVNLPVIAFGSNPFTIDVWFKMDGTQSINNSIISVAAAALANNWQLSFVNSVNLRFFYKGGNASDAFTISYTFSSGVWVNVVISKNSNNDITSYVNGVSNTSVNYAGNYNHTEILRMGLNRGGTAYYKGNIGVCRLYSNKSLSSSEILQNYNATKSRFGL